MKPTLALLTDITHRLEHYHLEGSVQRWCNGLRRWAAHRAELRRKNLLRPQFSLLHVGSGDTDTTSTSTDVQSKTSVGYGEGSGPRWWSGIWDEHRCEREGILKLEEETLNLNLAKIAEVVSEEPPVVARHNHYVKPHNPPLPPLKEPSDIPHYYYAEHVPECHVAWDGLVLHFDRQPEKAV